MNAAHVYNATTGTEVTVRWIAAEICVQPIVFGFNDDSKVVFGIRCNPPPPLEMRLIIVYYSWCLNLYDRLECFDVQRRMGAQR
jgi:hypothetical protein